MTVLLFANLCWIVPLLINRNGNLHIRSRRSHAVFLLLFFLCSGCKEIAVPVLGLLFLVLLGAQWMHRHAHLVVSTAAALSLVIAAWRILVVVRTSSYAQQQMTDSATFNLEWYAYRLRSLLGELILWNLSRPWLAVLVVVLNRAGSPLRRASRIRCSIQCSADKTHGFARSGRPGTPAPGTRVRS